MIKALRQTAVLTVLATMLSVTLFGCGVNSHKKEIVPATSATTSGGSGGAGSGIASLTGSRTLLDIGETNLFGIAKDSVNIYYTAKNSNGGLVLSIKKDGSQATPTTLVTGLDASNAFGIDVDTSNVYFTQFLAGTGALWSVPKIGGTPTRLAKSLNNPTFVRLNNVTGGDGKLYLCENISNSGRIDRFTTTQTDQVPDSTTEFITQGVVPPFNLHLLGNSSASVLVYTEMNSDLSSSNHGEIHLIATNAPATTDSNARAVAVGLLNPTDFTVDPGGALFWTEYTATSGGGVFKGDINGQNQAGTLVGSKGPDSEVGCSSITVAIDQVTGSEVLLVTRNLIETSGGGLLEVDPNANTATALTPGANFPWQLVGDSSDFFMTEFNFSSGTGGSLNPSRLVKLTF